MSERRKILVVDDDDLVRDALKLKVEDILSSLGNPAQVDVAGDGQEALQLLQKQNYSFVLMDTQMPGLYGYELCSQMKKEYHSLTIFGMSADAAYKQKWMEAGADGFISKFQLNKSLAKIIDDCVNK